MPDVLALPLKEARERLEKAGFRVEVRWTGPAGRPEPRGTARVLRQRRLDDGSVEIVAARHTAGGESS